MTAAELRALCDRVLAMAEPRCTCGHVLTGHSRRRLACYGRPACGCLEWTPVPRRVQP